MTWKRPSTSACAERRGGLVHDQHAHVVGEGLGDLHDLLLTDAQVADELVGVDVLLQACQQLACLRRSAVRSMATPRTSSWARKRLSRTERLGQRLSSWKMMPTPCCGGRR